MGGGGRSSLGRGRGVGGGHSTVSQARGTEDQKGGLRGSCCERHGGGLEAGPLGSVLIHACLRLLIQQSSAYKEECRLSSPSPHGVPAVLVMDL